MTRLAILAVTLGALTWSGDAFVSTTATAASSETTTNEPPSHPPRCHACRASNPNPSTLPRKRERPASVPVASVHPLSGSSALFYLSSHRRSSSLKAALLNDSSSPGRGKRGRPKPDGADKKGPGWHRRILGKIPWRRQAGGPTRASSSSLPSAPVEHEEPDVVVESFAVYRDAFVSQDFDALTPESVLPVVQIDPKAGSKAGFVLEKAHRNSPEAAPVVLDSEFSGVSITPALPSAPRKTTKARKPFSDTNTKTNTSPVTDTNENTIANSSRKGMVARVLEGILTERIGQRWTVEEPEGLEVDVRTSPNYNNIAKLLFRGLYRADATLSSGRIIFPNIRFSSVRLEMEQVTLNLMGFFLHKDNNNNNNNNNNNKHKHKVQNQNQKQNQNKQPTDMVRYPNQFDIHIEDLTMSRHDLLFSSCVKNGLRGLLVRVLKDRGIRSNSIRITSIDILPNGKISCTGEAKTHFASAPPVNFEVRSGISYSNRGHVLTFPGLEVSLNSDIGLFVPVHPTLDLDVGHNTKFRSIVIDGRKKRVKIAASVTITPDRTRLMTQDYVQTSEAFAAIFFYDVGQWLTRLGRFSK